MKGFLKELVQGEKFELLIDTQIFSKDIILKATYNFLDKGYFFFSYDKNGNIILQFSRKEGILEAPEKVIGDFSDELLSVHLRDKLEHDNKSIREKIIGAAIANSLDSKGFVEFDSDRKEGDSSQENGGNGTSQIDFDKDIDAILKEIENDPDLKIDEAEIEKILKEIETETEGAVIEIKSNLVIDPSAVKNVKKNFKKS